MKKTTCYLNTDLELSADQDLTALAAGLEARGVAPLRVSRDQEGSWHATFETIEPHADPEHCIAAMMAAAAALPEALRAVWSGCTRRELNIGYACGAEPWAFNQGLSGNLLGRMAAVGVSLRITLYPPRPA